MSEEVLHPGPLALFEARQSYFFSSHQLALITHGVYESIRTENSSTHPAADLHTTIDEVLQKARKGGVENPIVIGALPFDRAQPGLMIVPESYQRLPLQATALTAPGLRQSRILRQTTQPTPDNFQKAVVRLLDEFHHGQLQKVVLSRTLEMELDQDVHIPSLLAALIQAQPHGYHFSIPTHDDAVLIGVSPELLLAKKGLRIESNPLAGSIKRNPDPLRDQELAANLKQSAKDLHEHRIVVDEVRKVLEQSCEELDVPALPSVISTPQMWHLSTRIHGMVHDPRLTALRLAEALHPTPAVCGFPPHMAKAAIKELETFDRELFTGMVGWMDGDGNGEWVVTIRCGLVKANFVKLYAGAGIVAGSNPRQEWDETNTKIGTMLHAFNLIS
ncbi:isochorismate synthase [Oligoflexus tunisiensis]|uniref:isochorismate synthase n=1 Tax=Oligoflexus tunisiensis TaxID=708132 RepID=UPI000B1C3FB5|nr:isochorismate synthase [Oligoflexus tunisiensis]